MQGIQILPMHSTPIGGGKESACNAGDPGLTPGSGRSPGEGNGNPLQYSCLENSMDRGAWQATVHETAELDMTERLTLSLSHFACKGRKRHQSHLFGNFCNFR